MWQRRPFNALSVECIGYPGHARVENSLGCLPDPVVRDLCFARSDRVAHVWARSRRWPYSPLNGIDQKNVASDTNWDLTHEAPGFSSGGESEQFQADPGTAFSFDPGIISKGQRRWPSPWQAASSRTMASSLVKKGRFLASQEIVRAQD